MKIIIKTICFLIIALVVIACTKQSFNNNKNENTQKITILYTADEHGWIEASEYTDGAAKIMGLWRENEGYDSNGQYLILSGGDNWTGPAISTWFEGESTVDIMNAMEYDAAVIGNHEFDFTLDGLMDRIAQAEFPYLSANIRDKSGSIPDFATPYMILNIDNISVGIIGLTTLSASYSTFPEYVKDYDFIDYNAALEYIVPLVKKDGAELLIVIAHICYQEMIALIPTLVDLGIDVITGGHCHNEAVAEIVEDVALMKSTAYMQSYAKLEIYYDFVENEIQSMIPSIINNENGSVDPAVEDIVSYWRNLTDAELYDVIGYTGNEIIRESTAMHNMVADSWLYEYPEADISMTNAGGIRQSIPSGEITKETIIGLLPFQNYIIELHLSGAEVKQCTYYSDMIFGGMTTIGGYFLMDGTPIDDTTTYKVLTTDYLYYRNDSRFPFNQYDPNPYFTSMNYHQPTIDWITSLKTSSTNPLENYLDYFARR